MSKAMADNYDEKQFLESMASEWAHDEDGDNTTFNLNEFRKIYRDMAIKMLEEKH